MNDFYRGFEIEKQADGFYVKLDGVYKFGPFPRDDKAMDAVDAYLRNLARAKQEG